MTMFRKITILAAVASISLSSPLAFAQQSPAVGQPAPQMRQPEAPTPIAALVQHARPERGQYFGVAVAPGFQILQESSNCVIVASAQHAAIYGLCGWIGMANHPSPDAYARTFCQTMQFQGIQVTAAQQVPPAQGFAQATYYEFNYVAANQQYRGGMLINVAPAGATSSGAVQFFAARPDRFDALKPALSRLAQSASASSANSFGAKAHFDATRPRGDYGIGDWKPYDASKTNDRIFRHQSEGMLGYDNVHDPNTGTTYQPTWDHYDPSIGGYRNPQSPDEPLRSGPAWDPEN
jgi:hypothetical protein